MASKKYCPICDKQIHGRFCTTCMQFVKPCEHEVNYHLNEGHDLGNDPNCDYHGTTTTTYRDMPEMPKMEDYYSSSAASDKERMERAKRSFESHGEERNTGNAGGAKSSGVNWRFNSAAKGDTGKTKKNAKVLVNTVIIIWIAAVVLGVFAAYLSDVDEYDSDDIYVDYDDDYDYGFEYDYGYDDAYEYEYLDDEEYQALLAENGFDEDGYKYFDYDELLDAGEPCNGIIHFDGLASRTAARHIRSSLEDVGIEANNDETDYEPSNYAFMDYDGTVYTYYESYMYIILGDETADEWEGLILLISDSVTDELMEVYIMTDDQDMFVEASKAVLMELDEECDEETVSDLGEVVSGAVEEGVQYSYLCYGNLWYDFVYYGDDDDYYAYTTCIYLME